MLTSCGKNTTDTRHLGCRHSIYDSEGAYSCRTGGDVVPVPFVLTVEIVGVAYVAWVAVAKRVGLDYRRGTREYVW